MTTPNLATPSAIIRDAAMDAGLLARGATLGSEAISDYFRKLNKIVNTLQTQGLKLWLNQDITVPLTAGTAAYTFAPSGSVDMTKPLRVLEGYWLDTSTNTRRPLIQMGLRDYWTLGQAGTLTSNRGSVSQYLVEKLQTQLKVTFWPCPDDNDEDNGEVHLLMQVQVTNAISLTETMTFPLEWCLALEWALADEICTGQPPEIVARCQERSAKYVQMLEGWDVEDAPTRFTPNTQMLPASRFR